MSLTAASAVNQFALDGLQSLPAAAFAYMVLALKRSCCKQSNQHKCSACAGIPRLHICAQYIACTQKLGLRVLLSFPAVEILLKATFT